MPRYDYNNLAFSYEPEKAPACWPWRSQDERDRVWNRPLPEKLLRTIQEVADHFDRWIKPIVDCGPEAQLLVASSLSIPRLRELLDGVTMPVLEASAHRKRSKHRVTVDRTKKPSAEEAFTGLLCVLEGIQCMSAVIAGKDDWEWIEPPDEDAVDPKDRRGFGVTGWAPADPFEHGMVMRALGKDWDHVRAALLKLPEQRVLHARLSSGLRLAAKDLCTTAKKVTSKLNDDVTECVAYSLALATLRDVVSERPTPDTHTWCLATAQVSAAGQLLRNPRWTAGYGHETNQSLRVQLQKKEAFVRQYALLMRGNGPRHRAMMMLNALCLMLSTGKRHATTLAGKWKGTPNKKLPKLFKNDVVEPDLREQWNAALAGPLKKCEQLIRIAARSGQAEPWTLKQHYKQFVKRGLVGGESDSSNKRRIVDELLAPMQALGLAAQTPWGRTLDAGRGEKTTGTRRVEVTLDTYHGKAWVVNPLGLLFRAR
jgi:hypothetical protein